jgi:hypothetical protein
MFMRSYIIFGVLALTFLAACSGSVETLSVTIDVNKDATSSAERELEIVTLLPRDAIPAIDNPTFISADEADGQYEAEELVIGVNFDGDARAYSIPVLSSHEIVNDTVAGRKIAVTW